jgi:hypothetical protein
LPRDNDVFFDHGSVARMKLPRFRISPPQQIPVDTRRVNLTDLGHSPETLTSRIDWPDAYRPLDPAFATPPVDEDAIVDETFAFVGAVAPFVDEFTADALNGWLDEHLPGWSSRTDYETNRRLDVQRTLIAEITQNYAVVAARLNDQRARVAELEAVVKGADRVLAGHAETMTDPADSQPFAGRSGVTPFTLPDPAAFGHPDLLAPQVPQEASSPIATQGISIVPSTAGDARPGIDTEGEVA